MSETKQPPTLPEGVEVRWRGHDGSFAVAVVADEKRVLRVLWCPDGEWIEGSPGIIYRAAFLAERERAERAEKIAANLRESARIAVALVDEYAARFRALGEEP